MYTRVYTKINTKIHTRRNTKTNKKIYRRMHLLARSTRTKDNSLLKSSIKAALAVCAAWLVKIEDFKSIGYALSLILTFFLVEHRRATINTTNSF